MQIEKVTHDQVMALVRAIGPLSAVVCNLGEVDLERGRGVLEGDDRCLWTKDGRRITISIARDGGAIVSCSRTPDEEIG